MRPDGKPKRLTIAPISAVTLPGAGFGNTAIFAAGARSSNARYVRRPHSPILP
jgi:hypothetical protein